MDFSLTNCQLLVPNPNLLYFFVVCWLFVLVLWFDCWLWVIVCVPIVSRHCYSPIYCIRPMTRLWFFTWPDRGWHGIRHLEQLRPKQMQTSQTCAQPSEARYPKVPWCSVDVLCQRMHFHWQHLDRYHYRSSVGLFQRWLVHVSCEVFMVIRGKWFRFQ